MSEHRIITEVVDVREFRTDEVTTRAVAILAQGGLVALPTDTVYGLAANVMLDSALRRIFAAKQRPADIPIPILIADAGDIAQVAVDVPSCVSELADRFWPGPLTIVLCKSSRISDLATADRSTVGLRVPDHELTRCILRQADFPVAVTSANLSGAPETTTPEQVLAALGGQIEMLIDDGLCPGGLPSTVLDLTCSPPRLLRSGPVCRQALEAIIGSVDA